MVAHRGVRINVSKGDLADEAYVDFQNTFDKALHQRLLKKTKQGLGKAFLWTEGWLKDKKRQVGLQGHFSG